MQVITVQHPSTEKLFYDLPRRLYQGDPCWVVQLGSDVEAVFHPQKNPFLQRGEAARWLLLSAYGQAIGRIAACYYPQPEGIKAAVGFFECRNNQQEAFALLDAAMGWLRSKGADHVVGPVNFGEKDRFWGLLTSGFEPPLYLENYNPPYYAPFFTAYGFRVEETIHTYRIPLESAPVSRLSALARRLEARHAVRFAHMQLADYRTFMHDFYAVYQASFKVGSRMNLLAPNDFEAVLEGYKRYLQEDLIWVLYVDGKPAGILALVPDLNSLLRNAIRPREPGERVVKGFVFAVAPAYRKLGVDAALACRAHQVLTRDNQPTQLFLAGISTRSSRMISFIESMGGRLSRIHTTYSYSCTSTASL